MTGESWSSKSYFSKNWININEYIFIDIDIVFSDKPKDYLFSNFDDFYLKTLNYFKNSNKTIVIDSDQYRNMKNVPLLKGQVIGMGTSVDTYYKRIINRFKEFKEKILIILAKN